MSPPTGFGRPGAALSQPRRLLVAISGSEPHKLTSLLMVLQVASLWCRDRVIQLRVEKSEIFLEIVVVTTSAGILLPNISLEKERSCQSYLEQSKTSKNAGPWSHLGDVLIEKITLKSS